MSDKDMINSKIIDENQARIAAFEDKGRVPVCHICGKDECYTITIQETSDGDRAVRNFLYEKEGALCVSCFNWMQHSGTYVTKFLHMVLKTKIFVGKLLKGRARGETKS